MEELMDTLLEVIREACQDLGTISIPLRPCIRAVPATSGTGVWSFQNAPFRADWGEVARQAQIIRAESTAADRVRGAFISVGLQTFPSMPTRGDSRGYGAISLCLFSTATSLKQVASSMMSN